MLLIEFLLVVLVTVISTMVGALLVILERKKCVKKQKVLLILEAAVMIGLSAELTIQGLFNNWVQAVIGFIIGLVLMLAIHTFLPHEHSVIRQLSTLVVVGFLIHEVPEGMALGVSSVLNAVYGLITAFLIGLQNFPEGAIVALPMVLAKQSNRYVIKIVFVTQVFFAIAAVVAFIFLQGFPFNDALLTIAAGAMTYLVYEEVIISRNNKLA